MACMTARERWSGWVEAWWRSGLTAKAFAAEHGLNESTLRYNARLLRRDQAGAGRAQEAGALKLARVEVVRTHAVEAPIELQLGEARVVVRRGFDRETLSELLDLLGARR
jgi:transposase-like protein